MRILCVHPFLKGDLINPLAGGKSHVSLMLTRHLQRDGHEVAVFPFPERIFGKPVPFQPGDGDAIRILPTMAFSGEGVRRSSLWSARGLAQPGEGPGGWINRWMALEGLRAAIRSFRPDIIHSHQSHSHFIKFHQALGDPTPVLLTHHTGALGFHLPGYAHIHFVSRALLEEAVRAGLVDARRAGVMHEPVDPVFSRAGDPLPAKREGIAFVGRLNEAKGLDLLLQAYCEEPVLRRHTLHLFGAADSASWREFAAGHDLPVVFEGRVAPAVLRARLSETRLLVNPSRREGFSIALLEALTCGTPVVGWPDQIREIEQEWGRAAGFPFDAQSGSPRDLADTILRALDHPTQAAEARNEISERARSDFSFETYTARNVEAYRKVLTAATAGRRT